MFGKRGTPEELEHHGQQPRRLEETRNPPFRLTRHIPSIVDTMLEKVKTAEFIVSPDPCQICKAPTSKHPTILCAECGILLCFECFTSGTEQGEHQRQHDYYFLDRLSFPLYSPDWTAAEELRLLRGTTRPQDM
jgi:hypothetical protein